MAANETGFLVIIDDVAADNSSRMDSEVDRVTLTAMRQLNTSKLIGRCFTLEKSAI